MSLRASLLSVLGVFTPLIPFFGGTALAQDLTPKAPPQSRPVAIINATVHPVSSPAIDNGFIFFDRGEISGIGAVGTIDPGKLTAEGWTVIDAKGKHVYPGLFAPYTQLGLIEIAAVRATLDMGEVGPATPETRAVVAVNPDSTLMPVARSNGVLLAGVFPETNSRNLISYFGGPGGLVPGRAGVIRLDGWTWENMTISDDAGLVIDWPQARPVAAWWMDKTEAEQQKDIDRAVRIIDDLVTNARIYAAARKADPPAPADIRLEAMRALFEEGAARRPVFIHATEYDQIQQAVTFANRHGLKCVIVGGRDAPLCADLLKRHNVAVIIPGTVSFPKRDDQPYDDAFTLPKRLDDTGVTWCLGSGEEAAHERNLPYAAAMAVAFGLDHEKALRSITLAPAEILGVNGKYGSIDAGKSATVFIADGDILEVSTNVERAFIDGREIVLSDKQKVLDWKYREKYKQQQMKGAK